MTATVDAPVVVEVHRTSTPARDLPLALVHDVVTVLRGHGLDPDLLDLSTALYEVIQATAVESGGLGSGPAGMLEGSQRCRTRTPPIPRRRSLVAYLNRG